MSGRAAIVTGGTRGIGGAISIALKEQGFKVAANYGGNDEAAREFTDVTGIPTYKFDVGDFDLVQEQVAKIEADLAPVDVLVNNAGITRDGVLSKMTFEQWDKVIRTNLTSCFNLCRAVFPGMRERGYGRIVNIGSVNGQAGQYGQVNYAAAKSGIHGFTKALALEGARYNITVNAVAPGYVNTEMVRAVPEKVLEKIIAQIPVGRLGETSDVVRSVLFLVAEDADFVTGSTLSINGGQHMY
jgi:acetoacetyl-CoA reductase